METFGEHLRKRREEDHSLDGIIDPKLGDKESKI